MSTDTFTYSGQDNLEAMRAAVRYNAFLADLIARHARPGERLLDFGAGLGTFADLLRARGHAVDCLEADASLAATLRSRGLRCALTPSGLDDTSIDYVYSLNVLEHIDDDVAALAALAPKLRPRGRCLIYVPAFPILFSAMDVQVGHHRRYTANSLSQALRQAGYRITRIEYVDCLGFAAALAYRLLGGSGTLNPEAVARYDRWVFPASRMLDPVARRWVGKNVFAVAERVGS